MVHDVFISYSSKDKSTVDAIANHLENEKIRCWYADRDIPAGEDWADSIIKALESAKIFVLVFTDYSNASKQVLREVDTAVNQGIPIIPFKLTDTNPSGGMKYYLSTVHWLDAMNEDLEKSIGSLAEMAKKLLSGDSTSISSQKSVLSPKKKSKAPLIIGIAAAVLVIAFLVFYFVGFSITFPGATATEVDIPATEEPVVFNTTLDGQNEVEVENENSLLDLLPDIQIDADTDTPLATMAYGGQTIKYTNFAVTEGFNMDSPTARIDSSGIIYFTGSWGDDRVARTVVCGGLSPDFGQGSIITSIETSVKYTLENSGGATLFGTPDFSTGMAVQDLFYSGREIFVPFVALDENNEIIGIAMCALVIPESQ